MKRKLLLSVMAGATAVITFCGSLQPADAQQQQKPNILFIMGDDIGWMQPRILSPRPDGWRDTQHR